MLENINFQLEEGFCYSNWSEWVRKKYITKIVAGLDNDFEGEVVIDGEPILKRARNKVLFFKNIDFFHG